MAVLLLRMGQASIFDLVWSSSKLSQDETIQVIP